MPAAASTIHDTNARPRTPAQAEASRANGACSRGPTSAEGRRRSALNATRHGLRARAGATPSLSFEDEAKLAGLRSDLARRWPVETAAERHWLDALARCHLRQEKLDALELLVMDALLSGTNEPGLPALATLLRYRRQVARETGEASANLAALIDARPRLEVDTNEPETANEMPAPDEADEAPGAACGAGVRPVPDTPEHDTNEPDARARRVQGQVALAMAIHAEALRKLRGGRGGVTPAAVHPPISVVK